MQQININLPSTHPLRAMQGLAKAIAIPAEHAPQRFPSFPALERTAVMAFTQPLSVDLVTGRDTKFMVTRQAGFPVWADFTHSLGESFTYDFGTCGTEVAAATEHTLTVSPALINWSINNRVSGSSGSYALCAVSGGPSQARLPYPPTALDAGTGNHAWVYIPNGFNWYTVVNYNAATANTPIYRIIYDVWLSPGETATFEVATAATAGTNFGVMTGASGSTGVWIRPRIVYVGFSAATTNATGVTVSVVAVAGTAVYAPSAISAGQVNITIASTTAMVPLTVSSEFANSTLPWYATRTTASAMLGTNVTQILNKAGTVLAGRISPNVQNPFNVDKNYITALHPAEKAWLPLETGVYTYCPPSTDMSNFWDYTIVTGGGAKSAPIYRLDNDSMVNIVFITPGSVTEQLAVTASWHIEFRTSSALFQVALSGMTLETFHQCQLSLAAAGFFFDNPDHKAIISRIIAATQKIAPYAMAALGVANPKLAGLVKAGYNAGAAIYNHARSVPVKSGPMRLPTTSAKNSGILRGGAPKAKARPQKGKRK